MTASSPSTTRDGAAMIAAERSRQLSSLGWTRAHDVVSNPHGELVQAAGVYLRIPGATWPWPDTRPHLSTHPTRDLTKAGALIAAELDRVTGSRPAMPDGPDEAALGRLLDNAHRAEARARQTASRLQDLLDDVRRAAGLPGDVDAAELVAVVRSLRDRAGSARDRAGERTTDGGHTGHLDVCGLCDGDGLLFRPDPGQYPDVAPTAQPAPAMAPPPRRACDHADNRAGRCVRPLGCLCTGGSR